MPSYGPLDSPGAISFKNEIMTSTIVSVMNENKLYPASNLIDPRKFYTYRTTRSFNEHLGFFQVVFKTTAVIEPTVLALINTNITKTTGTGCMLLGSSSADLSTDLLSYVALPLYEAHNGIHIWYLGTPEIQLGASALQYWALRIYPNNWGADLVTDPYFEIGNIWLGDYTPLNFDYSTDVGSVDQSTFDSAHSGAEYHDGPQVRYDGKTSIPMEERSIRQELMSNFRTYGKNTHVLIDLEAYSEDDSLKGHGHFYGKLDGGIQAKAQYGGYSDIDLDFLTTIR